MPDPACSHARPSLSQRWYVCPPLPGIFAVPLLLLGLAGPVQAQSETPTIDKLTTLRLEWQTQVARQEAAEWEMDRIAPPRGTNLAVANFQDPSVVLKELRPALMEDYNVVRNKLVGLAARTKARLADVQKDWTEAYRQRITFRQYAEKQQAGYGFDLDSGSPPGFKPNAIDGVLLAWAAVVFVVAVRLRRKERRLAIRRGERALATAALLIGLLALPGCGGVGYDENRQWTAREEADLTTSRNDAREKADATATAANKKWQAAVDSWVSLVGARKDLTHDDVQREETDARDRLREIAIDSRLANRLADDAETQRAKLAEERTKLDELVASARWRTVAIASCRIAAATLLFGLSIAPFWSARRARRAALRLASRTCPRCFSLDTLKIERTSGSASPSRYRGKKKPKEEDEAEETEDKEVRCTKCGLRIRKSYLTVPRLCFPTVGVRSSGKTHMLVTAYDRIRKRTAPTAAIVQPAPSGGDVDKRFDRLIEEILHRRGEAGATDLQLPDPILVHLKDCDRAGENSALVNLFDYSGELINPDVDVNQLKATAVRMDGFMLFLDPTQLYGDGANVTLDEQLGMLDQFLAHMRRERKVPVGGSIPVPVAVCIPKFDLLLTENPIGGQSVPFIRRLLNDDLSPPPREMTLEVIKARSELVEEMLSFMFTGADVRGIVEGYFGKQVMFFPMSSVSLFEHELGIRDLSRRTIAPFGVAEPIAWLLQTYGYEMFG